MGQEAEHVIRRRTHNAAVAGRLVAFAISMSFSAQCQRTQGRIMTEDHPVANEAEAVAQASRLTDLHTLTQKITARQVVVRDDRTPFLWKQFEGKPCWQVDFETVSLRLASAIPGFRDTYVRTFSVRLDVTTGQLLGVTSLFEGQDPDLRPQPSGAEAESQLSGQEEIYHGLPSHPPRLTFLAALDTELTKGIGSPFLAKEIYGSYVMHSRSGAEPRAVWVITLNGLPPMPVDGPFGNTVPVWQRNHMRNVIDDATGTNLFATNSPQPK